ncbi:MAG: response regulator [Candidatus Daviesbacteria bacterium]|nr:response regulator [Candidatus Daviesbacteria bacterium]
MKKQILIIEDEQVLLELLSDKFKDSGFVVSEATSAEDGIKKALQDLPDLILLDILLPKMDGLTMLKKLRQDPWGETVPVIVLSNLSDQKKVSEAIEIGVYDFLVKSEVKLADIVKQVREVLQPEDH